MYGYEWGWDRTTKANEGKTTFENWLQIHRTMIVEYTIKTNDYKFSL